MNSIDKIKASIYCSIIGDALGVPVESFTREELSLRTVKKMFGYGRFNMPAGTWSDDSSMILCTLETFCNGYSLNALAETFCKWLYEGYWTPHGYAFDVGLTTYMALDSVKVEGISPTLSGRVTDDDNGNGSLMRMLPAAIWFKNLETPQYLEKIHEVSAITHANTRTLIGCGIYALFVKELLKPGATKETAYASSIAIASDYYSSNYDFASKFEHYKRILDGTLPSATINEINSSGYVVDTLEAALWCVLNRTDVTSTIISAVNLGIDTDTTGSVAGGLAGLVYGMNSVPQEWLTILASKDAIDKLVTLFLQKLELENI